MPSRRDTGYSGTPLSKKLGIEPGAVVVLIDAPGGFERALGELPEGARLVRRAAGAADLALLFVDSAVALHRRLGGVLAAFPSRGLWIAWPKKSSGYETDLSDGVVREAGLASGLVDYKVCAIDHTWSGLKFAKRRD